MATSTVSTVPTTTAKAVTTAAGMHPKRATRDEALKFDRALWFSSAFRSFPKGKPWLSRLSLGGCTMVVGPHVFRMHFWQCLGMPRVALFEFVVDNPGTTFCALPYELQLELSANGSDELAGIYTPMLAFSDPPFPSQMIAGTLAATAPHRVVLIGVSVDLLSFFRAADPVLSQAAVTAATFGQPRSAAISIPALITSQQQQQPPADEVVLSTQPPTPVLGVVSRPTEYSTMPRCWLSPRRMVDGPLRIPHPSEVLPPLQQQQQSDIIAPTTTTVSTSAPDESAIEVQRMRAMHRNHKHARHASDGIEALALAAMDDAGSSAEDDMMVDEEEPQQQPLPPRTFVVTPGLRTPDLDEEVARVLLESAQRARDLVLAASQPPSDAEGDDEEEMGDGDVDGDYEEGEDVMDADDGGEYTEMGIRRYQIQDGTPVGGHHRHHHHHKMHRTLLNRGKVGGSLPTTSSSVPACRWDGCNQVFGTIAELTNHLQTHTVAQTVHACKWDGCARVGKPFGNHSGLFRHLRYHTGDKPCRCNVPGCGFASVDNGELRRHLHLVHHIDVDGAGFKQ